MMVLFWVLSITRHLVSRGAKRDHVFAATHIWSFDHGSHVVLPTTPRHLCPNPGPVSGSKTSTSPLAADLRGPSSGPHLFTSGDGTSKEGSVAFYLVVLRVY